ncbi:FAD-binding oxidoreductase [Parasphingorhabdus sp.]|uniref:FAD-binding oxidoreductase n=1 Tax=Parasphingorhabdus sp. TaxID=2709688 RepID=UPI0032EB4623
MSRVVVSFAGLVDALERLLGADHVSTNPDRLELASSDFSEIRLSRAAVLVQPGTTADVAELLKLASVATVPVVVRGGGMSYTLGYAPRDATAILIDMSRFDQIEINEDSRILTVGAGTSWASIDAALAGTGLALRFRGTLSGSRATVGGGLGNNATGLGQGDISNDLLGIEVVLPDSRVIQTGARAIDPDLPGVRHSSPDLTGLFINDAGVFGVRTKVSFRLSRAFSCVSSAVFTFDEPEPLVEAMCAASRLDIASEIMSFCNYHHRVFAAQPGASGKEAKRLAQAIGRQAGGGLRGALRLARLLNPRALTGLVDAPYSVMINCDAFDAVTANRHIRAISRIVRRFGGKRKSPALAYGLRAQPFVPISSLILGMNKECSIPTNCTVPMERARELQRSAYEFFARNRSNMERYGVTHTYLMLVLGNSFGMEPIIYWKDSVSPLRLNVSAPEEREALASCPARPEARAFALDLRQRLVSEVCDPLRGAHFQLGKFYPLKTALASPDNWTILQDIKDVVDAKGLMNPGGLGMG